MGSSYGRKNVLTSTGQERIISADGRPIMKHGGGTIDWTTVTAVAGADATLPDGTIVPIGKKYIRYGTPMDVITATGKYGPVDTGAVDGRAVMARGETYVTLQTVIEDQVGSDHVPLLEGGLVYEAMLNVGGAGQATLANLMTALPLLQLVKETA